MNSMQPGQRALSAEPAIALGWQWRAFAQLTPAELYDLLQLRQRVFVVEQNCAYLDCDDADRVAQHLLGRDAEGRLMACLRVLPPGVKFDAPSIGRVCNAQAVRGQGVGHRMMKLAIERIEAVFPGNGIKISAQRYLLDFYREHGFEPCSEPYLEDDIPHVEMVRSAVDASRPHA